MKGIIQPEPLFKKGEMVVYKFAFKLQEAKVLDVYGPYLKVRHKDFFWFILPYIDYIHVSEVIAKKHKNLKMDDVWEVWEGR